MPTPTQIGASLAGALVALSLSACGSSESDDFADQSVDKITSQAEAAMKNVKSLRLAGTVTSDEEKIDLDLAISTSGDCAGSVGISGAKAEVLVAGGEQYMKGSKEFWKLTAGAQADQIMAVLGDKWAKIPSTQTEFSEFCDLDAFLDEMKKDDDKDKAKKGKVAKVGSTEAVEIVGKDEDGVTHAWVATEGKHYIVKISNAGKEGGEIAFSDFNEPVGAKKPAAGEVLDFSKLG
ncbi:MAG: hypothetical protein J7518_15755 [Nocardioidaceae bacterium]|nr:hypothetical protein [Nocardioidaceae bacterium]